MNSTNIKNRHLNYVSIGIHEYVVNVDYNPLSVYDLLEPSNWVHHTPLISENGVTKAWTNIIESEKDLQQVMFID